MKYVVHWKRKDKKLSDNPPPTMNETEETPHTSEKEAMKIRSVDDKVEKKKWK